MRFSSRLVVGLTTAAALAVVSAPGAAIAAPAKKTPVLTVKVSPGSVVVGHQVTITPALHLPAKDKLKSYTVTFADGSKATGSSKGVKLPKSWKHTYKKALSGKVTVTVKDTLKHTYSATAAIKVTTPPVVTPPLPPVPVYTAPTGVFSGHVSSNGVALGGITVAVTDDDTDLVYAVETTDSHGNWAVPSLPAASSVDGDDIDVNTFNGFTSANPAYNVGTDFGISPATNTVFNLDLPPVAAVTGPMADADGTVPSDTQIVACAFGCAWFQIGTVDSTGHYSLPLGTGLTWTISAVSLSARQASPAVTVTVPAGATAVAGPTVTLQDVPQSTQSFTQNARVRAALAKH